MFPVFEFLSVIAVIVSVFFDITRANEGDKSPMTCYSVDNGILWCSQPLTETTEHSVSFLEDVDDQSVYKSLVNFLGKRKPAKFVKKFLLACKAKIFDKKTPTHLSRDCAYQVVHPRRSRVIKLKPQNYEDPPPFSDPDLPEELNFLYVGSERNRDADLRARGLPDEDCDCDVFQGKAPEEIHKIIMEIIRARFERGYYNATPLRRPSSRTPIRRKPSIKDTYAQVGHVVREIRNGAAHVFQKVKQTKVGGKVIQRTREVLPRWQARNGSSQDHNQAKVKKPAERLIEPNFNAPRTPQPAKVNRLLLPQNNRPVNMDPDAPYLLDEGTPFAVDPEDWSRPVDAKDLRRRLLKLEKMQQRGYSLRP